MKKKQLENKLLEIIHSDTGWGDPLTPYCECEDLNILNIENRPESKKLINFRYIFDEDGFSQYDKTHVFEGSIIFQHGNVCNFNIKEVHSGVASIKRYRSKLKNKEEKKE